MPRPPATALPGPMGTCTVYVSPVGAREADREARGAKSNAPFPAAESAGLATIITNVGRQFGICLERKREFVTSDGRFAVDMDFMKVQWIDNGSGRLLPAGRESRGAVQAVCRLIQSVTAWAVGSTSDLVFTSTRQVAALKGIGPATPADLKALGLKQMPKHKVLQAIIAACAKLVRSGDVATKSGRAEHRILLDAVSSVDKTLAARLETVAMICQPLKVDLGNLGLTADSLMKESNALNDALAIRSEKLGIVADNNLLLAKASFVTAIGLLVLRQFKAALEAAAIGLELLEAADKVLIEDVTYNNLKEKLAEKRRALALNRQKISAVIERQKELGCP